MKALYWSFRYAARRYGIRGAIYHTWLEWFYRNADEDICCCGGYVSQCDPWGCGCSPRSMREYTITSAMQERGYIK